jgi:hypothetical protein
MSAVPNAAEGGMRIMRWQVERLIEFAEAGVPIYKCAEETAISYYSALKIAHKARVRIRRGRRKGSRSPRVDPALQAKALAMMSRGSTLRAAAAAVNVSHECVRLWLEREGMTTPRSRKKDFPASPRAPWASPEGTKKTKPEASKTEKVPAPPIDPRVVVVRGVSLARRA